MNFWKVIWISLVAVVGFGQTTPISSSVGFTNGMEVGIQYRKSHALEYKISARNIPSILKANLNPEPEDREITEDPERGIDTAYEKYMCGIETRLIETPTEYLYIHESVAAGKRFQELIDAMTPGLETSSPLVQHLLGTWEQVNQYKSKYLPETDSLYISSEHIAKLFLNIYDVYRGILPYKTGDKFPPYVGLMDFDNDWNVFCDSYFKLTPQGIAPVEVDAIVSQRLREELSPNKVIIMGDDGKPKPVSLQDCAKLAQREFLDGGFIFQDVLLTNKALPDQEPTSYDKWLASFKDTSFSLGEKVYSSHEIRQKAVELALHITRVDGKMRERLLSSIDETIEEGDSTAVSGAGKTYHKVRTIDSIVANLKRVYDVRKEFEEQFCLTFFDNLEITQIGNISYSVPPGLISVLCDAFKVRQDERLAIKAEIGVKEQMMIAKREELLIKLKSRKQALRIGGVDVSMDELVDELTDEEVLFICDTVSRNWAECERRLKNIHLQAKT